ncbi:Lsr2 family protein [Nocardia sp. BMG51109]|uniref:histone-like nucleoid-structuring protein Lsr2 n=1 Tax=Nocardia sp. BMG51109 TaxID=1056816 RepID=UPI000466414A|nr:Lsr2 family protein [Nocardia sp. BMG51109]
MAKKTIVETFDDLNGERIDSDIVPNPTIRFAVDGVEYEIELGAENRDKFYTAFEPYVKAARKVGGRRPRRVGATNGNGSASVDKAEVIKIRDWAQATGRKVSTRGRLPKELVDAYRQANS